MAENKYEKFIVRDAVQPFPQMGGNLNSPFVSGGPDLMKAIEGAIPNFALYYVKRAGMFMETPHYHTNDEYLSLSGAKRRSLTADERRQPLIGADYR